MKYSQLTTKVDTRLMNGQPRNNEPITTIVVHHNAGMNSEAALNTWLASGSAGTSAHYQITESDIINAVEEDYIAYHAGNWNVNVHSIGLEHVNNSLAPTWTIAEDTYINSAHLIVDICERYNLPIDRNTIRKHSECSSTSCPGGIDIDKLVRYAQDLAYKSEIFPTPEKPKTAIEQFKNANNFFTYFSKVRVDEIKKVNGIWQFINYDLAGGKDFSWTDNGIPLDIVDNLTRGNVEPTQIGDTVIFKSDFNRGKIDKYDVKSNGVGIKYSNYGMIWFNADEFLKG